MLLGKLSALVFKDDRNKSNISVSGRCTLLYVLERNYFRKECESNQKYTLTALWKMNFNYIWTFFCKNGNRMNTFHRIIAIPYALFSLLPLSFDPKIFSMVNVFPPTGKEGETSRKHGAAVLGLIASHVYSRSAIIQMRVQIQLHRDACTNTVAHIKLLMQS